MDKVQVVKSNDADTRSAEGNVTKESLIKSTLLHIGDVENVGTVLAKQFIEQIARHDHTKIEYIDEFYNDFKDQLENEDKNFKEMPWFKERHLTERHHLNDSVPEDVNLLDVLEMVIDCTVAGLARSGSVYPLTIPQEVLEKAIDNTMNLIIENTEVIDPSINK